MDESDEAPRREEAKRLYRSGLSERAVADQMGISRSYVQGLLDRARVRRRRVGAPRRNRHAARS